ncbi:MAG: ACP S-malonyltransferase [Pseudomonadota bacterium]
MTKRAVVIFPGRGTYGRNELGYLATHHRDKQDFLAEIDDWRAQNKRTPISDIDSAESYSAGRHASSLNASSLIYACALSDFADIDLSKFEIVAICGNSLGWYLSLAAGGALAPANAIRLVDTMGALMETDGVGGQMVYPTSDEQWRPDVNRANLVNRALDAGARAGAAHLSINLGGTAVLAGDDAGLDAMEKSLPSADERYPFRLARHAAFHTPLLEHVSKLAFENLPGCLFDRPQVPVIDGRGVIWNPLSSDVDALYQYTLGAQIFQTYDFSKSVEVALKEFAPEILILPGPGSTLGAPIGQCLVAHRWWGIQSKDQFVKRQKDDPVLLAMGRPDQRSIVVD